MVCSSQEVIVSQERLIEHPINSINLEFLVDLDSLKLIKYLASFVCVDSKRTGKIALYFNSFQIRQPFTIRFISEYSQFPVNWIYKFLKIKWIISFLTLSLYYLSFYFLPSLQRPIKLKPISGHFTINSQACSVKISSSLIISFNFLILFQNPSFKQNRLTISFFLFKTGIHFVSMLFQISSN